MDLVWIVPLGVLVGVVVGALGGGGAIITVPILVYLVHQEPAAATTGALIIVAVTSLVGMIPHHRSGRVHVKDGLIFGAMGVLGAVAGSALNRSVPAPVLMTALSVLLFVIAALMARRGRPVVTVGADEPRGRGRIAVVAAATCVGLLTGFFGVGGGFAVVPALVLLLGLPMPAAVGTSLLVIVVNCATALVARTGSGVTLDWPVVLAFSVTGAVGSLIGARVAQGVDSRALEIAFTVLLVAVACVMAYENVPLLLH